MRSPPLRGAACAGHCHVSGGIAPALAACICLGHLQVGRGCGIGGRLLRSGRPGVAARLTSPPKQAAVAGRHQVGGGAGTFAAVPAAGPPEAPAAAITSALAVVAVVDDAGRLLRSGSPIGGQRYPNLSQTMQTILVHPNQFSGQIPNF